MTVVPSLTLTWSMREARLMRRLLNRAMALNRNRSDPDTGRGYDDPQAAAIRSAALHRMSKSLARQIEAFKNRVVDAVDEG